MLFRKKVADFLNFTVLFTVVKKQGEPARLVSHWQKEQETIQYLAKQRQATSYNNIKRQTMPSYWHHTAREEGRKLAPKESDWNLAVGIAASTHTRHGGTG